MFTKWDSLCGWGSELFRGYVRLLLGSASMLIASITVYQHMPHMLTGCLERVNIFQVVANFWRVWAPNTLLFHSP